MKERDELLRAVAFGELAADAPEVVDACQADPSLEAEIDEVLLMKEALDDATAQSRSDIAEAREAKSSAGEDRVVSLARQQLASLTKEPETSSGPRTVEAQPARARHRSGLLAAAALVVVFFGVWRALQSSPEDPVIPDIVLGSKLLHDLEATYDASGFTELRWRSDLEGGWYEVRVFDLEASEIADAKVREPSWRPDAEEARGWPKTIEWQVRWIDASGVPSDEVKSATSTRP